MVKALEGQGWSVWWDLEVPPGTVWDRIIEKKIRTSKCVIVVWSKKSVDSIYVMEEAREGLTQGKLIPVLISGAQIPFGFKGLQTANLTLWRGSISHPQFQRLLKSISDLIGKEAKVKEKKTASKTAKSKVVTSGKRKQKKSEARLLFMGPVQVSPELAAIVGPEPKRETKIITKLWDYIKKNKLQDRTDPFMINADSKLLKVFSGKKKVNMFEMTKMIRKHVK